MRRTLWSRQAGRLARRIGMGSASIVLSALCGCSWNDVFPAHPTIPNAEAVDRALQLCSLSAGDRPFHLILDVAPPADAANPASSAMAAQIEVFWLNPITYRTVIRSRDFSQTRIVNGPVVEEHNIGDFYPRWIENFLQAILDPVPKSDLLRKIPGSVPIGRRDHACITSGAAQTPAQVCFQDAEPRIATGSDGSRTIWFDDFAPFGQQQIARSLVDKLPGNLLAHGHIDYLAPLSQADYPWIKAMEFTLPNQLIQTELVSPAAAEALLQITPVSFGDISRQDSSRKNEIASPPLPPVVSPPARGNSVLIRTDRTGKVREAYCDGPGGNEAQQAAIARAKALRFKPLIVDGAPRQMEATIPVP